jgi:hypothetical protein
MVVCEFTEYGRELEDLVLTLALGIARGFPLDLQKVAPGGVEPPVPVARLSIPARIVQTSLLKLTSTTREDVTMSDHREAGLCALQDAEGNEETELITIDRRSRWFRGGHRAD